LKISLLNVSTVLIFFTAGLLFLCLEHVIHRERIASRWRPAFSSHLICRLLGKVKNEMDGKCVLYKGMSRKKTPPATGGSKKIPSDIQPVC